MSVGSEYGPSPLFPVVLAQPPTPGAVAVAADAPNSNVDAITDPESTVPGHAFVPCKYTRSEFLTAPAERSGRVPSAIAAPPSPYSPPPPPAPATAYRTDPFTPIDVAPAPEPAHR